MRLQAKDFDGFLFLTGLLGEAGIEWQAAGGNELNVPDDTPDRLDAEQRAEAVKVLANVVAMPEPAPAPKPSPTAKSPAAPTPPGHTAGAGEGPAARPAGAEPPRSGAGSGRDAWAAHAATRGVTVPEGATRDEIIALVDQAGQEKN
jgi:hypothetical protein